MLNAVFMTQSKKKKALMLDLSMVSIMTFIHYGLSYRERKRTGGFIEEQQSCCVSCQEVLRDPQSTNCGHCFCRQCIASYWEQCESTGDPPCPQCSKRSRKSAELQTPSDNCTKPSKYILFLKQNFLCCCSHLFIIYFV